MWLPKDAPGPGHVQNKGERAFSFFSSLFCFSLGLLLTVKLLMQNEGMEISYCSS